jgi:hypothetical protein
MSGQHRNFDMDQSGMKEQLLGLQHLIAVIDPEFMSYLESSESANLYFCFRWLLVRFKRELSYSDTLRCDVHQCCITIFICRKVTLIDALYNYIN